MRATVRPALNAATVGTAAPVVSTAEDIGSVILSVVAVFAPVLVLIAIAVLVTGFVVLRRRSRAKRA